MRVIFLRFVVLKKENYLFRFNAPALLLISRITRNITRIIWNLISAYLPRYGGVIAF